MPRVIDIVRLNQPANGAHMAPESSYLSKEGQMKQLYETPTLMDYGAIAESTFGHPRRHHWHHDLDDEGSSGLPEVVRT